MAEALLVIRVELQALTDFAGEEGGVRRGGGGEEEGDSRM